MKVNTNKKNVFKRVINIILAVLMGIVAFISVGVFTLACIGSCSSKTATVKADDTDIVPYVDADGFFGRAFFADSNYLLPCSNFYLNSNNMYPNDDLSQNFIMGCNVAIRRGFYTAYESFAPEYGGLYIPTLCVRSSFNKGGGYLSYYKHKNGVSGLELAKDYTRSGVTYRDLTSFTLSDDGTTGYSSFYYGKITPYDTYYSAISYSFDTAFDCVVSSVTLSSSVLTSIDGLSASVAVNTLKYIDEYGKSFTVNFYSCEPFGIAPNESYLWNTRTYYYNFTSSGDDAYQDGYNAGYDKGVTDGYNEGYDDGYDKGYDDGVINGNGGYDSGYNVGYNDGYDDGYDVGYNDGSNNELTSANFFRKVFSIFDVKIFGFMSLGDIFKIVFVLGIGVWALKVFAGG